MAQIMRLLGEGGVGVAVFKREPPGGQPHQAGNRPQQRRLARPVGPAHQQGLPCVDRKAQRREHPPAAPDAGKLGGQKPPRPPNWVHQGLLPGGVAVRKAVPMGQSPAARYLGKSGISAASC